MTTFLTLITAFLIRCVLIFLWMLIKTSLPR